MWLVMIAYLQLSGSRLYLASLVGLLTPYWLVLPYVVIEDRYVLAEQYVEELTTLQNVADFSAVATAQWAAAGVVMLLVLFGMIRYYRHKDYDRHRLRMAYNGYAVLFVFSLLLFLFQPQLVWLCLAGMIVCGSPFITRLFTLLS